MSDEKRETLQKIHSELQSEIADLQEAIKAKGGTQEEAVPLRTYAEENDFVDRIIENESNPFSHWSKPRREAVLMCKIADLSWHPDSQRVLMCSQDGTIIIQNMINGMKEFMTTEEDSFLMTCSMDSYKGEIFAVSGLTNIASIYRPSDDPTGDNIRRIQKFEGHEGYISGIEWLSPGATTSAEAVTGSGDGTCCIWDVEKGKSKQTFSGHTSDVSAITTFKEDDNVVVSGSRDHTCRVWDKRVDAPGTVARFYCNSEVSDVKALKFGPAENKLFGCSTDAGIAMLFDLRTNRLLQKFEDHEPVPTAFKKIDFSSTGKYCFIGGDDGYIFIYDTLTAEDYMPVAVANDGQPTTPVSALKTSPDGMALCSTARSCIVKVYS